MKCNCATGISDERAGRVLEKVALPFAEMQKCAEGTHLFYCVYSCFTREYPML